MKATEKQKGKKALFLRTSVSEASMFSEISVINCRYNEFFSHSHESWVLHFCDSLPEYAFEWSVVCVDLKVW